MFYKANKWNTALTAVCVLLGTLTLPACQTMPSKSPPNQNGAAKASFTASQIAELKALGFNETDEGWELSFAEKLLFDLNAFKLNDQSRLAVGKVSKALLNVGIENLRVEGHTDATGGDAYNNKLSMLRANAVADAMSDSGMQRSGITAVGRGKGKPVADNATPTGRAENRRVAIIVLAP